MTLPSIHESISALRRRAWYDYAGFATCAALVAWNYSRSPAITLLLLPTLGFDTLAALSFLLRDARISRDPRWWAQVSAYGGGFLVAVSTVVLGTWSPDLMKITTDTRLLVPGLLLWAAGGVLKIWPLWHLRRAFSIEPAARRLVRSGPYRFARHPIYLAHALVNLGIFLQVPSVPFAGVLVAWFGFTLVRIRAEDETLAGAFPEEHRAYRARIAAFGPRVWALQ